MLDSALETRSVRPTMRAVVYDGTLRLGTLPRPRPGRGEVTVRVRVCGISRVDLDVVSGRRPVEVQPAVLGHQFVGIVEEVGENVDESWRGRRVVARPIPGCGRCVSCRFRRPWLCEEGSSNAPGYGLVDGAFAEWVNVRAKSLEPVPDAVDDEEAVFAHPVALALEALRGVEGPAPQRVLVTGDGNMGLLVTQVLHAAGHTVGVYGRHPSRRELLWRSGIGFTAVPDAAIEDPASIGAEADEPFSYVVECTGRLSGLALAARSLRPRGRIILLSDDVGQGGADLRFLVEKEAEILGVSGGPLAPALEFLGRKGLDVLPLVSGRVSLVDAISGFDSARRRGSLKVLIAVGEGD